MFFYWGGNKLKELIREVFRDYRQVAEKSSGALALSVIQMLVMMGCLAKREALNNIFYYLGLTGIAFLAIIGFFTSILSVGAIINDVTPEKSWSRRIISWLFYPVGLGVFLVAAASLKSL